LTLKRNEVIRDSLKPGMSVTFVHMKLNWVALYLFSPSVECTWKTSLI